jgi:DNA-binding MarR family transcriptional regulator
MPNAPIDELITVAVSEADWRVRIVSITDEGLKARRTGKTRLGSCPG